MDKKTLAWVYLFVGGMFETVWATTMFMSEGFSHIFWTIITIIFLFISVWFLDMGLKSDIPTGVGYSVWVGIGALGAVIVGILLFNEPATLIRLFFVLMIIVGIVGLEMFTKKVDLTTE
ncbi:MAG TPA: multidrug efflux SMR transporter [Candidatus Methanomethylophilaceae archaeon]|nr:multidrug efflux SMR transporter [Candidatus Methanomethylophilaceae archaeon]